MKGENKKMNNYCIKTYEKSVEIEGVKKEKRIFIILERSYYSQIQRKYVVGSSMFIEKELAQLLINNGVRLFDNATIFNK